MRAGALIGGDMVRIEFNQLRHNRRCTFAQPFKRFTLGDVACRLADRQIAHSQIELLVSALIGRTRWLKLRLLSRDWGLALTYPQLLCLGGLWFAGDSQ